jgi:endonuclease/exonuclease/phosphatase family metal-dependent hydrolase
MPMIFRVLDFNVGLLQWFGRLLIPAPYVDERLAALPAVIRGKDANVVLLQEIYREPHRQFVARALADIYPHAAYVRKGRHWGLENGLMTMAREPLETRLEVFHDAPIDERLFDHKGVLITTLARPRVTLFNLHATAGGVLASPEAPPVDAIRARQIRRIMELADRTGENLPIIAGDLNAGPGVSDANYRIFERAGYIALHAHLYGDAGEYTWDPHNALNETGPHRTSPPQRIDHIFVRRTDLDSGRIRVLGSELAFTEAVVEVPGRRVTLSDHYGLLAQLEIDD